MHRIGVPGLVTCNIKLSISQPGTHNSIQNKTQTLTNVLALYPSWLDALSMMSGRIWLVFKVPQQFHSHRVLFVIKTFRFIYCVQEITTSSYLGRLIYIIIQQPVNKIPNMLQADLTRYLKIAETLCQETNGWYDWWSFSNLNIESYRWKASD